MNNDRTGIKTGERRPDKMKGIANPDFILIFVAVGVGAVLLAGLIRYIRKRRFYRDRMEDKPEENLPDQGEDREPEE